MVHPRINFGSVLLTNGTLLAVGDDGCVEAGAGTVEGSERTEMYDPATDHWTEVGSLNKPRGLPKLVARPDGTAMVLGGVNQENQEFSSTKIYPPADRAWSPGPLMIRAGVYAAVALPDGTIISVGLGGIEILDPGGTAWRRSTPPPRGSIQRLVLLADGLVVAVGLDEEGGPLFLTFAPDREVWAHIDAPSAFSSDLVALDEGSILNFGEDEGGSRVERYDRVADRWIDAAPMSHGRVRSQMTRIADGRILVAGGVSISVELVDSGGTAVYEDGVIDTTEIYDLAADTWTPGPRLRAPRQGGYAMTLPDGSVLVYGGYVTEPDAGPEPDTGSLECPPPIAETERLYVVP